ncbi:MAG: hypothetical protein HQK65_15775 [Desulfamplus sp.]|nr:hypothetical protein [Desulfamplus sp.]
MKKRIQALEKKLNIADEQPPNIILQFTSELDSPPITCLRDGDGNEWCREADETEEDFKDRAFKEARKDRKVHWGILLFSVDESPSNQIV